MSFARRCREGASDSAAATPADLHGEDAVLVLSDANKKDAPTGHIVPIRELRLSAGAEFIVAFTGEIMTMPGLPKVPSADFIRLNERGQIEGLF